MIFAITPEDCSIDFYTILYFELDSLIPLYGEMEEQGFPLRNPFCLLSIDFLRKQYEKGAKSFGNSFSRGMFAGAHEMAREIPDGSFHIFDEDITLAKQRLKDLLNKRVALTPAETAELEVLKGESASRVPVFQIMELASENQKEQKMLVKDDFIEPFFILDGPTARTLEISFQFSRLSSSSSLISFLMG
jgi:hypothetical protein